MLRGLFTFLFLFCAPIFAGANLTFPTGVGNQSATIGRVGILQELGYGTSSKLIAEPYALGGYRGLEVSLTYETVPTDQLNVNGNGSQSPLVFSRVAIGKGLYKNIDVQLNFIPFDAQSSVSGFGATAKWMFLEGDRARYNLSFQLEGNLANFNNQLIERSMGGDLILGTTFDFATMYIGSGWLTANGEFRSPEAPSVIAFENVSNLHWFAGAVTRWDPFFIAAQLDQFQQTMLSFRLGVRL